MGDPALGLASTLASALESVGTAAPGEDPRITALRLELRTMEAHLRELNEELETSNEELKSANEELQAMNEERQSTNEELETSKEELQSVNEEMSTVNTELQNKVAEPTRANNDMNNLLAGTGIATVFVDLKLCILRFTPAATQIINLIANDIGRPVGHIVLNLLGYDSITHDAQLVLETLIPKACEVQTRAGAWYTMRILPYRTLNNVIEGVVITFVDISKAKTARAALQAMEKRAGQPREPRYPVPSTASARCGSGPVALRYGRSAIWMRSAWSGERASMCNT